MTGKIKSFLYENKKRYVKGAIALLLINVLQVTIPKITGKLIDSVQLGSIGTGGVVMYSSLVVAVAAAIFGLNYLTRLQIMGASLLFQYQTRNHIFNHLEKLSTRFFNKNTTGDIMALSVNDVSAVRMALGRGVNLIIDTLFLLILSLITMGNTISIKLTLIAFLPFPLLILIAGNFGIIINKRFKMVQESFGNLTTKVQENISGIRVIKAFVQEKEEIENFKKVNRANYEINMKLVKTWGAFYPLTEFLTSASYLIVLVYGSTLVLKGEITLGDFIALNSYIGVLVRPIRFIGSIVNVIQKGRASMERIEKLFGEKSEVFDSIKEEAVNYKIKREDFKLEGTVDFKNLTFRYSNEQKPVLKDINLSLKKGKITAVVGKVGSGKSTLANLVLRLYNPLEKGQLLIDGIDITEIPLKTLRSSIGYVPQDNFLFSQSIKDNIAFSEKEYSMEEIKEAAKISQIYQSILDFPDGFNTVLGERGVNISGGQKQRISIARAIIGNPSILILDDCLSAVDTSTESKILKELKDIMKSCSCLIISHRISTIKYADEIVLLDEGSIAERGTHNDLIELGGLYYEMYKKQILEESN
ncbi:ABC transporter ATP-binding protein/permease [Clostridium sp. CX1]|uniref:ABC transporter ATP-binding protein n=1 Tax=Clostridium sp. CX1 TaxID=2978346 RepID=UPI0021C0097D|nr:ABC transporter ATP-binding protein [Clostridium sp. CX1]MCT8978059.1 ABC transporter ATP-binding protein/permease [Clostridium sp. CX1]